MSNEQKKLYQLIDRLPVPGQLSVALGQKEVWDYYVDWIDENNTEYLVPNDTGQQIVARSHRYGIAVKTGFYDMDDFYNGSDYCFVVETESKKLIPAFELDGPINEAINVKA